MLAQHWHKGACFCDCIINRRAFGKRDLPPVDCHVHLLLACRSCCCWLGLALRPGDSRRHMAPRAAASSKILVHHERLHINLCSMPAERVCSSIPVLNTAQQTHLLPDSRPDNAAAACPTSPDTICRHTSSPELGSTCMAVLCHAQLLVYKP
jgi:hypothetical protein